MPQRRRIPVSAFRQRPVQPPAAGPDALMAMFGQQQQATMAPPLPAVPQPPMPQMPWEQQPVAPQPPMPTAAAYEPDLSPQEEKSLLQRGMGAIQYLGESIEKPGYAVRGAIQGIKEGDIGGAASSLLNLIPFYDTLQESDLGQAIGVPEAPKVSGWEFGEKVLGMPENQEGWDWWDLPKFATEVATNPISYFTGLPKTALGLAKGAKGAASAIEAATMGLKPGSKAFKAAVRATTKADDLAAMRGMTKALDAIESGARPAGVGVTSTPWEIAQQVRTGERALGGFGIPFMQPKMTFGAGSERTAKVLEALGYTLPVRTMRGIFSHVPGVGGMFDPRVQKLRDIEWAKAERAMGVVENAMVANRRQIEPFNELIQDAAKGLEQIGDRAFVDDFMRTMQSIPKEAGGIPSSGEGIARLLAKELGLPEGTPYIEPLQKLAKAGDELSEMLRIMQRSQDDLHGLAKKWGIAIGDYGGPIERYTPRISVKGRRGAFDPGKARREYLTFPRSTKYANHWAKDGEIRGIMKDEAGAWVRMSSADHKLEIQRVLYDKFGQAPKGTSLLALKRQLATERYVKPPLREAVESGLITPEEEIQRLADLLKSGTKRVMKDGKSVEVKAPPLIDKIVRGFDRLPLEAMDTGMFEGDIVKVHWEYMGKMVNKLYNARVAHNFIGEKDVVEAVMGAQSGTPFLDEWKSMGLTGKSGTEFLKGKFGPGVKAADYQVSTKAGRILRAMRDLQKPATLDAMDSWWGKVNAIWKAYLTLPRIAFHTRNLEGGFWNSVAEGLVSPGKLSRNWGKTYGEIAAGKAPSGLLEDFINAGGMKEGGISQIHELMARGNIPSGPLGGAAATIGKVLRHPIEARRAGKFKFLKNMGIGDEPANIVVDAGQKMYALVEYMNRAPYYLTLRETGFSHSQAMNYVKRAQFYYSQRSPFERKVLTKVIPFWGWTRNNLPLQIKRLMQRPIGSPTGMAVKGMSGMGGTEEGEFVPQWLKEGLAIPIGGPSDKRQFIRQGGLPIEDLNRIVLGGGPAENIKRTLQRYMAMVHPAIISPVEYASGTQFFTGRPLAKTPGYHTGVEGIDEFLAKPLVKSLMRYLPTSSITSDVFNLLDPKKTWKQRAVGLTTGIKTGTYDLDMARLYELQWASREDLRKHPYIGMFELPYIKQKYKGRPEAAKLQRQLRVSRKLGKTIKGLRKRQELLGKGKGT